MYGWVKLDTFVWFDLINTARCPIRDVFNIIFLFYYSICSDVIIVFNDNSLAFLHTIDSLNMICKGVNDNLLVLYLSRFNNIHCPSLTPQNNVSNEKHNFKINPSDENTWYSFHSHSLVNTFSPLCGSRKYYVSVLHRFYVFF
jgi:hypothetical protein